MTKGLVGIGALLVEMSIFMNKTPKTSSFASMIGMALVITVLTAAVQRMGKLSTKTIAKGVLGLGGIMTAFSMMAKFTKDIKLGKSIITLAAMAGALYIIIEAFKAMDGMDADSVLKFSLSISAVMLALSGALKILSTIPIHGALTGIANFAIFVAGLGTIIAALGWLQSEWSGMTDFLEEGGNVLGQIGQALGKFIGGIAGGLMQGLNLPQIGSDLSDFMTNSQGFIDGARKIDGSVLSGVGVLTGAILAISGTEFTSALVSLFTGGNPVTKFTGDLKTLGDGLSEYAASVAPLGSVSDDVLTRSIHVAERCLCDNALVPALMPTMIYDNGASMKYKGYDFCMRRITRHLQAHYRKYGQEGYILLYDFSKFFDRVSHAVVKGILEKTFTDERVKQLTGHFIDAFGPVGLGLGSQISQVLALASANRLDHFIKEVLRIRAYGRYMDDGYLIHPSKAYLQKCLESIFAVCDQLHITLNQKKTQLVKLSHGFTWLQSRIFLTPTGKVVRKICKKSICRARRRFKTMKKRLDRGEIVFRDIWNSWQSWSGYARKFNAWHTIQNLGKLYNQLFIFGEW